MEVLQNIIEGIEKNKNSRKQNEWDEKYHSIQGRIEATLEGYEIDRLLLDKQMVEKVSTSIKFTDNLEELSRLILDPTTRNAANQETQVFIVGYKNRTSERLQLLNEVFESLDASALDDSKNLFSGGMDEVNQSIDESLLEVSGAIGKLDDLSTEIMTILAANRTGNAQKKRRMLERKLNTMKTDMEKLNITLLNTKSEVAVQESKNYSLQARLIIKDEEMAKIEEEKLVLVEQREIADRERSIARTEKMDQIFMYEGRIKEMKLLITKPKETGEKEVQTDECKIEYVSEDENEEQIVENKGQRPKSASSRLKKSQEFNDKNLSKTRIVSKKLPKTRIDSKILPKMSIASENPTKISIDSKTQLETRAHSEILNSIEDTLTSFEVVHIPSYNRSKSADNVRFDIEGEEIKDASAVTSRVTTAVDGSTIDDKSVLSNESTIAQPPSIRPSSPQKEIDSQIKVELRTYEGLGVRKASTSELLDTADVKEQISRRPPSAINTTKALVRCFNKLLWFAAEVEEVCNVQVLHRISHTTDDETLLSLDDTQLKAEIQKISNYVDKLLDNISMSLKSNPNFTSSQPVKMVDLTSDMDSRYKELYQKYHAAMAEIDRMKSMTKGQAKITKSMDNILLKKTHSVRSPSATSLSAFFDSYDRRQQIDSINKESDISVPNNSPRADSSKRKMRIELGSRTETKSSLDIQMEPRKKIERLDSVTQSLISITDEYADNSMLTEFNKFTENLTDEVLRKKELSENILIEKSVYDSGYLETDDVFEDYHYHNSTINVESKKSRDPDLQIKSFAKQWSQAIKSSEYAPQIMTSLNQMDLLESRREKIWHNLTKAINQLRYNVRYQIRKATKELRLRTIKQFQPDLFKLYIEGERFRHLDLEKYSEPIKHNRPGRLLNPGKLHDFDYKPVGYMIDNFDSFELTGAGCMLNSMNVDVNKSIKLPQLRPTNLSSTKHTTPMTMPRLLEMDIQRSTIPDIQAHRSRKFN